MKLVVPRHFKGILEVHNHWCRNNFKLGEQSRAKVGDTDPVQCAGKNFFGRAPPLFGSIKAQLVILVRAFSLVSFLFVFLLLAVPPRAQPFVKVGGGGTCKF